MRRVKAFHSDTLQVLCIATKKRQVVRDNNGYYMLSYPAEHEKGEAGYREVKVTTRNPDFGVRARKGYLFGG